jgi:hypothetical protein
MYRFRGPEEHAKCTRYSAVWQCSGVPHNFVPEHVPVPEHASPNHLVCHNCTLFLLIMTFPSVCGD